jgi:hypothetical protein
MKAIATAILTALLAAAVCADDNNYNKFSIWESKDCSGSPIGDYAGDSDLMNDYETYYNGYIGSIKFDDVSYWATELDDVLGNCIYTAATTCCAGAPTCRLPFVVGIDWHNCQTLDMRVSNLVVTFTNCDTVCRDNIYRKDVNGTESIESE